METMKYPVKDGEQYWHGAVSIASASTPLLFFGNLSETLDPR